MQSSTAAPLRRMGTVNGRARRVRAA
jgi:hypothetical protein